MAFGLFRKRVPEAAAPVVETKVPSAVDDTAAAPADSAREILELLDLELGGLIRQLERAAQSVAGGAEATATIRERTEREAGKLADEAAQSYARDMGSGITLMMREIDVPVRVRGRHWGGFRTAYKP
jgi:methyl-accepting chemotaxis protein